MTGLSRSHRVYRDRMREHLHQVTLRHWDVAMRMLGASTLQSVLGMSGPDDLNNSIQREVGESATPMNTPTKTVD
jgi:hypothetical protein